MLHAGDMAPDFTLEDDTGRPVRLYDLLDAGPVVLFFYPADFTRVCTREACMFRDVYFDLAAAQVQVVGISPQSSDSHARFRKELNLPFRLLADPERTAIRAFGASGVFGLPLPIGVRRATFLIGPDRLVQAAVAAELRVDDHRRLVQLALGRSGHDNGIAADKLA